MNEPRGIEPKTDEPVVWLTQGVWERILGIAREGGMTGVDRILDTAWGRGAIVAYVFGYLEAAARNASAEEKIDAWSRLATERPSEGDRA